MQRLAAIDKHCRRLTTLLWLCVGAVLGYSPGVAQEHEHMDLWASAGTQRLVLVWTFDKALPLYRALCFGGSGECLYTTVNPAFASGVPGENPEDVVPLQEGTQISIEIVSISPGLGLHVNGFALREPGQAALLGTVPFHMHPSWQVRTVSPAPAMYEVSYRLRASAGYGESAIYVNRFTLQAAATPTVTPLATPTPMLRRCVGDCNGNGTVTVEEIVTAVRIALGIEGSSACPLADSDGDTVVTVEEIVAAVTSLLQGCAPGRYVTFRDLWQFVLLPRCASLGCHAAKSRAGGLDLESADAGAAIVGAGPQNVAARVRGLALVRPLALEASFLWLKVQDVVPPEFGSSMPLGGPPLNADERQWILDWILSGAPA